LHAVKRDGGVGGVRGRGEGGCGVRGWGGEKKKTIKEKNWSSIKKTERERKKYIYISLTPCLPFI
jgi:hypothetical protein